jgi:hypothetical protein
MFTWVYKYRFWDEDRQANCVSEEMFTLEAIRAGLGVAIIESGRKVRLADVDEAGQLKRRRSHRDKEEA